MEQEIVLLDKMFVEENLDMEGCISLMEDVLRQTEEGSWGEASLKAADCKYDKNASLAYKLYGEEKERHLCVFGKE